MVRINYEVGNEIGEEEISVFRFRAVFHKFAQIERDFDFYRKVLRVFLKSLKLTCHKFTNAFLHLWLAIKKSVTFSLKRLQFSS